MIYEENHDNFLISDTLLRQWAMTLMRDQNFFFFFFSIWKGRKQAFWSMAVNLDRIHSEF